MSHDCIRSSGVRFIEVTYFLSSPLNNYWLSINCWLSSMFQKEFSLLLGLAEVEWPQAKRSTQDKSGFAALACSRQCNSMVNRLSDWRIWTVLYCTVERHRLWLWLNLQIMWILMLKGFEREGIIIKKYLISKGRPVTHWKGALVLNFSMRKQNWVTYVLIVTRYQRRGNREYIVLFHVHVFLANFFFLCRK